jgi:hypothetical protein
MLLFGRFRGFHGREHGHAFAVRREIITHAGLRDPRLCPVPISVTSSPVKKEILRPITVFAPAFRP